ncbi:MAG: hypothetical protein ACSHXB_01970 [Sulfitobacter sp.]
MRLPTAILTGASLMMAVVLPGQVAAEVNIYPYQASSNYCPAGMQPISISGVICCGTPNQSVSYQQAKAAPVKRHRVVKRRYVRSARAHCPVGTKGCNYD